MTATNRHVQGCHSVLYSSYRGQQSLQRVLLRMWLRCETACASAAAATVARPAVSTEDRLIRYNLPLGSSEYFAGCCLLGREYEAAVGWT